MQTIVTLDNVTRTYAMGEVNVQALRGITLAVTAGEFVAIMGASGSGKSTLMNIIGCLDTPDTGSCTILSKNVGGMSRRQLATVRNTSIGFVFQNFNLIRRTTALENVELPLFYRRDRKNTDTTQTARAALEMVGLADRTHHIPSQLSGGQQQRVAIARALVNEPPLLLADEPTGALDSATSVEIMGLFQKLNERGKTVVLVTHEHDIARYAKRLIRMRDGRIIEDRPVDDRIHSPAVNDIPDKRGAV